MLHKILITKLLNNVTLPSIQLYIPFLQGQTPAMMYSPFVHQSLYIIEVYRVKYYCCSLRRGNNFCKSILYRLTNPRLASWHMAAGPPVLLFTFRTTYFITESEWLRFSQQQLRFGSEGCLRSLKPLPPDGGLASVDGILRLISIKSSFMFIAFFALVSTKIAWMESA